MRALLCYHFSLKEPPLNQMAGFGVRIFCWSCHFIVRLQKCGWPRQKSKVPGFALSVVTVDAQHVVFNATKGATAIQQNLDLVVLVHVVWMLVSELVIT